MLNDVTADMVKYEEIEKCLNYMHVYYTYIQT